MVRCKLNPLVALSFTRCTPDNGTHYFVSSYDQSSGFALKIVLSWSIFLWGTVDTYSLGTVLSNAAQQLHILVTLSLCICTSEEVAIVFNDNEPNAIENPNLCYPLTRVYDNNPILSERSYKLLGIYLDEYLNLNHHVSHLCNKLSRALFQIKKAKFFLPSSALKTLYTALFHSHLLYCTNIISITSQTNINKIYTLQKKAIRAITNSVYNALTNLLFQQLHILPFPSIIKFWKLQFMHSAYNNYCSESFSNVWVKNENRRIDHNLRNSDDFLLPLLRIEHFLK
jgi:hypothetical protein